jgi:hypothetical protein
MTYRLAPDHFAAAIDDRAVILDVARDRYCMLGAPAGAVVRALLCGEVSRSGMERLESLGIVEPGVSALHEGPKPVTESALERTSDVDPTLRFRTVASSLARAMLELKVRGLKTALQGARARAMLSRRLDVRAIAIAQAYVRLRSRFPLDQICLPDSIALHRILCARGLPASLVLGVRLDPFMAHCWVQADAMVLNDSCDHVSAFTPILSL